MSGLCVRESDYCGATRNDMASHPFAFRQLWAAYLSCRHRKRASRNTQHYEVRLLDHLVETQEILSQQRYAPSRSLCFVTLKPKAREIHAADFSDRVVHHLLVPQLERLYEPIFIHDLYSNRKDKGTHKAVERLSHFMRSVTGNGAQPAYFLQLDIQNFFNTIHRPLLWQMVEKHLKRAVNTKALSQAAFEPLRWLTELLIHHQPTHNVIYRGRPEEFARIPQHKRLAAAPVDTGLPIGNLTSQFFANVYLNELDQFIKHQLKCRYYLRFVDDFILLHQEEGKLQCWQQQITQFLSEQLRLKLKPSPILKPVTSGADFLGYIVRPHYRLVRRRVVGNLTEKLEQFECQLMNQRVLTLRRRVREQLQAVIASYMGHFRHANHHRLVGKIMARFWWLNLLFRPSEQGIQPQWEPERVNTLYQQWHWFQAHYPYHWVLMQVGNRIECFNHPLDQLLSAGISWMQEDVPPRHPFQRSIGIPLKRISMLTRTLTQQHRPWLHVIEAGYLKGGMKRRLLYRIHQPE